jgi:hypothetical protein
MPAAICIAKVGNLLSIVQSMLHLELYDKSAEGPLTVRTSNTARTAAGVPFWRRKDLIDPTPKLNVWKNNLPVKHKRHEGLLMPLGSQHVSNNLVRSHARGVVVDAGDDHQLVGLRQRDEVF